MLFEVLFLCRCLKNEEKTIDILRKEEYNNLNITETKKIR